MWRVRTLAALVVCVSLSTATRAQTDPVSDWNAITLRYVQGDSSVKLPAGRPGPPGLLDVALVHAAVHDAVQAIEGRFEPYSYTDPTRRGLGSPAAAVAAAAHRMLALLYPLQQARLDGEYGAYLTQHGLADDLALETGEAAARALHAKHYRRTLEMPAFVGAAGAGQWQSARPMAAQFLAFTEPFTLLWPSQFRPPAPPPLTSEVYRREYEEVEARGSANSHPRDDTDMAKFWWSINYFTRWPEAVRQIASANLAVGDSARLFALVSLATADAGIAVWDSKRHYNFWRPSAAIRAGDDDPNHRTIGNVTWTPLIGDPAIFEPPYPDYVSGANGLSAAFTSMLRLFFGTDEMAFSIRNPDLSLFSQERHFTRLSDAEHEVVEARILVGIHFRAADEEGRRLGTRVAEWTFNTFLRPVPPGQR